MTLTAGNPMAWFPYKPRPHQEDAVRFAVKIYSKGTVGLLSADCGVGKTIAVLSGYLAARAQDPNFRLIILTRTHSQSVVFEEEMRELRSREPLLTKPTLTATSMVSRVHVCRMREEIESTSSSGFKRGCAQMVQSGQCSHYWNFYKRGDEGRPQIRKAALERVTALLEDDVVTRDYISDVCFSEGYCPYEVLRWCAKNSRIIIGPYSYIFKERVRSALLASLGVDLQDVDLLVDEAHNLPDHVLDSEAVSLSGDDLRWLRENKRDAKRVTGVEWLPEAIDFLWETFMVNLDKLSTGGERRLESWEVIPRFVVENDLHFLLKIRHDSLSNMDDEDPHADTPLERFADLLFAGYRTVAGDAWHLGFEVRRPWRTGISPSDSKITVRPMNAAGLAAPVLRGARSALLMSGTLSPLSHYAELLGVKTAQLESVASPYPRGSRLILLESKLSTKYTERRDSLWSAIAERISMALSAMPANKSALVAFPSYRVMDEVLSFGVECGFRGRIVESPGARLEDMKEALLMKPHAVFCVYGGKFSEGVDIVRDGSSMVDMIIGVGIPFSPPTSYSRALQEWFENRFGAGAGYYYSSIVPSMRKVAQLVGRLRRAPDDWGVVVLLDRRFRKHIGVLGEDIVSDVWPYNETDEMVSAVDMFLQSRRGN